MMNQTPKTLSPSHQQPVTGDTAQPAGQPVAQLEKLALSIYQALTQYPYYTVVSGFPALADEDHFKDLARAVRVIAERTAEKRILTGTHVSFTRVRVNTSVDPAGANSDATRYSRTHQSLPLHTDSSYLALPHELLAFQCITADAVGGDTVMMPIDDLLKQLTQNHIARLKDPVYPFGKGTYAILSGSASDLRIRYYQAQLAQTQVQMGTELSTEHDRAIAALNAALADVPAAHQFRLAPGQIIFINNRKALHGRTALSPNSQRLLYRVRLHVASLSPAQQTGIPDTAAAHGAFAAEAERLQRIALALYHSRRASELAPKNVTILNAYGNRLLKFGQFNEAIDVFRQCVALDPSSYDSGLALSSLTHRLGREHEARDILKTVVHQHPYIVKSPTDTDKATLLRLRGLEGADYSILSKSDGTYKKLLRGGHFSIENLLHKDDFNFIVCNILDNNLDQVEQLPPFDLILNTIACPDAQRAGLLAAARLADRFPQIPVINSPRQVLETTRERNSIRFNLLPGVTFPKTEIIQWQADTSAVLQQIWGLGFHFPFIIRRVGSQTGSSVALIHHHKDLEAYLRDVVPSSAETVSPSAPFSDAPFPGNLLYVIQFHDCRIRDAVSHKMRAFFIDGTFYPVANVFHDAWNIHSGNRYSVMQQHQWMQAEERAYLADPCGYLGAENFNRLKTIAQQVQLDFFGVDFTILADSTLFIFELNAAMRHNFDHADNFPYTEPYLHDISDAFEAMVRARVS